MEDYKWLKMPEDMNNEQIPLSLRIKAIEHYGEILMQENGERSKREWTLLPHNQRHLKELIMRKEQLEQELAGIEEAIKRIMNY